MREMIYDGESVPPLRQTANPGELVFIRGQMDDAAARNVCECARRFMIGFALHFERADEIAAESAFDPFVHPFEEARGIADDVRAHPVLRTEVGGFQGEGVVFDEGDVFFGHEARFERRTVDRGNCRAQLVERPGPAAGTGSRVDAF